MFDNARSPNVRKTHLKIVLRCFCLAMRMEPSTLSEDSTILVPVSVDRCRFPASLIIQTSRLIVLRISGLGG
jgi:hypothetical protein